MIDLEELVFFLFMESEERNSDENGDSQEIAI